MLFMVKYHINFNKTGSLKRKLLSGNHIFSIRDIYQGLYPLSIFTHNLLLKLNLYFLMVMNHVNFKDIHSFKPK